MAGIISKEALIQTCYSRNFLVSNHAFGRYNALKLSMFLVPFIFDREQRKIAVFIITLLFLFLFPMTAITTSLKVKNEQKKKLRQL